ncbi:MAG: biopolymer transporter ExbD [Candidatus Omnitrophica bacterium]|nr:biopolymer transporter ExbD [Candidatus Omnitrophota bacterium]
MAEINITPFTDVILVLLIIFMITTPLILQSSIKGNLPDAPSAKPIQNARDQVNITVTNENLLYLDNEMVTRKSLKSKLSAIHKGSPNLEVILISDKMVRFKDLVSILDTLNELGIKNLNIMAKSE